MEHFSSTCTLLIMKKKLITLCLFLTVSLALRAQDLVIPQNLTLESHDDYMNTEKLVVQCIDWLQQTTFGEEKEERKKVQNFLLRWMSGSPTVTIQIKEGLIPLDKPEILMAFMQGWTRYSLLHKKANSVVDCAMAGVEYALDVYNKNKRYLGRLRLMEKLIERKQKQQLRIFIERKFK